MQQDGDEESKDQENILSASAAIVDDSDDEDWKPGMNASDKAAYERAKKEKIQRLVREDKRSIDDHFEDGDAGEEE